MSNATPPRKPPQKPQRPARDVALLAGPTADGEGARVLRVRDGELSAGELRPMREGQDLRGRELVQLHAIEGQQRAFEVEVMQAPVASTKPDAASSGGPARVSNPGYRRNWERVFGGQGTTRKIDDYSLN